MSGLGSARIIPISLSGPQSSLAAVFRGGRPLPGLIVLGSNGLALQIAGARVPLPDGAGTFEVGQRVMVTFVQSDKGPMLQVTPHNLASPMGGTSASIPSGLLSSVLESLGALSTANLSLAPALSPTQIPLPEGALRALLAVFVARRDAGRALAVVSRVIAEAVRAGALAPEAAKEVEAFAAHMKATDAASLRKALRAARAQTSKPVEALLARLVLSGADTALRESLYVRFSQLRRDENFVSFLKNSGGYARFESAVEGLLEQFRGVELQQVRGSELPYQFIELPLHPDSEIARAQVHFFGDGAAAGKDGSDDSSTVVLDLSLSRLGDLWITLRCVKDVCICRIEAVDADVVDLISAHAELLTRSFQEAGYAQATVEARAWNGDRLEAVVNAFRGAAALDVSA